MRRTLSFLLILAVAAACGRQSSRQTAAHEMRTIESADPRPVVFDPPPVLSDEAPAPKPKSPVPGESPVELTEKDEEVRAQLPFAPAIAMDPVDGSKISIRADTPRVELKNHIYYFSSEENRRQFAAAPDQFLKGAFSKL
jgi:YHS domain-containing protein